MGKEIPENHIVAFNDHKIRRIFHNKEWWFSVIDVVETLTDSSNPRDYWYKMKRESTLKKKLNCRHFVDSSRNQLNGII